MICICGMRTLFIECLSLLGGVFTDLFVGLVSIGLHVIVIVLLVYRTPTEIDKYVDTGYI